MDRTENSLPGSVVVFDAGKTLTKVSLWDENGRLLHRRMRPNEPRREGNLQVLDVRGIEEFLREALIEVARMGPVSAVVPVGHGAAAAVVRNGELAFPVLDYEDAIDGVIATAYRAQRDAFAISGSPKLPGGLNLGAQLFRMEALNPTLLSDVRTTILPWAQFWAWNLSRVESAEVSSLGCHTDLWSPCDGDFSPMAKARGWAARFGPLRHAGQIIGRLTPAWAEQTGLSTATAIHCGVHDSNAALYAAAGFPEIGDRDATVLSTGTWFVAMRSVDRNGLASLSLREDRDCVVNVNVAGRPVPSARFMGGRELDLLGVRIDGPSEQAEQLAAVPALLAAGVMRLPSGVLGVGPYPRGNGRWVSSLEDTATAGAAAALYTALMAEVLLEQVGARERLLIEGRFAGSEVFIRALATLRPDLHIYISGGHDSVCFGALRLLQPKLAPPQPLQRVQPLLQDLGHYRRRWRELAEQENFVA